jgi:RHS repeat-associated protein
MDQLVMTQDANQRNKAPQQWIFTKYDSQGRPAIKGIFNDIGSTADANVSSPSKSRFTALQATQQTSVWEARDNSNAATLYSNNSFPVDNNSAVPNNNIAVYSAINYYDDYNIPNLPAQYNFASSSSIMTNGLPTASLINVIGTANKLWSVNYYDDDAHLVKAELQHYLGGTVNANNYDEITNFYSFSNNVTSATRNHYVASGTNRNLAVAISNEYTYDHMGREILTKEKINSDPQIILSQKDYNEIGQLVAKHLHSTDNGSNYIQNINYAYNERGWLTKINDPTTVAADKAFGYQLFYNDNPVSALRTYNGNVSSLTWQTKVHTGMSQFKQSYDYTYDNTNRLLNANYTRSGNIGAFNETVSYDKMDNLSTLTRTANGATIDQLRYTYQNSNQSNVLQNVVDLSGNNAGQINGTTNYTFDLNGNMIKDDTKPVKVDYNYLDIPQTITQLTNNQTIVYTYDANGRKLRKAAGGITRDYVNGIEYNNGTIEFVNTEEGRATPSTNYSYEYKLYDHLGNVRAMVKQDGSVTQVQDYYAFGMEMSTGNSYVPSPINNYKYNGYEYQVEFNINKIDYGARHYDPVIARWTSIDPLAVFYHNSSPYSYALSNPLRYNDDSGMGPGDRVIAARNMLGIPYHQVSDIYQRTGPNKPGTSDNPYHEMDCSEFVCRVMAADGITTGVTNQPTSTLKKFLTDQTLFIHSDKPQVGDIALWDGHTGIVGEVDKNGLIKLIHATHGTNPSAQNKYFTTPETMHPGGDFLGYFRPLHEKPDGKVKPTSQWVNSSASSGKTSVVSRKKAEVPKTTSSVKNSVKSVGSGNGQPKMLLDPFNIKGVKNPFSQGKIELKPVNFDIKTFPSEKEEDKKEDFNGDYSVMGDEKH